MREEPDEKLETEERRIFQYLLADSQRGKYDSFTGVVAIFFLIKIFGLMHGPLDRFAGFL